MPPYRIKLMALCYTFLISLYTVKPDFVTYENWTFTLTHAKHLCYRPVWLS